MNLYGSQRAFRIGVGDPAFNVAQTLELVRKGGANKIALMIFPELGISAYAIDDLLFQDVLLDRVEAGVDNIVAASRDLFPVVIVGAPLRRCGQLFNCADAIFRGKILGVVPKTYLPNYREFTGTTLHIWCRFSRQRNRGGGRGRRLALIFCSNPKDPPPSLCMSRYARTSGCPCRLLRRRRLRAQKSCSISPPATSPSVKRTRDISCVPRNRRAASRPMLILPLAPENRPPIWRGTGMQLFSNMASR